MKLLSKKFLVLLLAITLLPLFSSDAFALIAEDSHVHNWIISNDVNDHVNHYYLCGCGASYSKPHVWHAVPYADDEKGHYQSCMDCFHKNVTKPHDYSIRYNDTSNHSMHCTTCGYLTYKAHTLGPIQGSDPSRYQFCSVCLNNVPLPCSHSWFYYYPAGDVHQKICRYEGITIETQPHNYKFTDLGPESHNQKCPTCQYDAGSKPHTWKYVSNSAGHTKTCSACGRTEAQESHSLKAVSDGTSTHSFICTICSYKTSTEAHTLKLQAVDRTSHADTCTVCNAQFNPERHIFVFDHLGAYCTYCKYRDMFL